MSQPVTGLCFWGTFAGVALGLGVQIIQWVLLSAVCLFSCLFVLVFGEHPRGIVTGAKTQSTANTGPTNIIDSEGCGTGLVQSVQMP